MLDASLTDAIKDGEHLLASQPNDNLFVTVDSSGASHCLLASPINNPG